MPFIPYLHFQGTCAAAMTFYAEVFGADDLEIMAYADAPDDMDQPADPKRVMNSSLSVGGHRLMASDFPDDDHSDPQKAVSISFDAPTKGKAQALFDKFLEEGDVIMPFAPTFWSEGFGMVRDQFGTHWMISVEGPDLSRS